MRTTKLNNGKSRLRSRLLRATSLRECTDFILEYLINTLNYVGGIFYVLLEEEFTITSSRGVHYSLASQIENWLNNNFIVLSEKQPVFLSGRWIQNLIKQYDLLPSVEYSGYLFCPIFYENEPVGVLVLCIPTKVTPGKDQIEYVADIVHESSIFLSYHRLLYEINIVKKHTKVLDEVTRYLNTSSDINSAAFYTLKILTDSLSYVFSYLVEYKQESDEWVLPIFYPVDQRIKALENEIGLPLTSGKCVFLGPTKSSLLKKLISGEIIMGHDLLSLYQDYLDHKKVRFFQHILGIQSYIKIPVFINDELYGAVMFTSPRRKIRDHEIHLLKEAVSRLSTSISTIHLLNLIRDSESKYRNLVNTMQDGVIVLDENMKIKLLNPRVFEIFGKHAEEKDVIGKVILDFLPDKAKTIVSQHFEKRKLGVSDSYILRFKGKGGTQFVLRVHGSPIFDNSGKFKGVLAVITDVSELTELSEKLASAKKMESLVRIAGGIAHDFNNILTVITGNVDLILSKISSEDPIYTYLEQINKAAWRAAELTKMMLTFSRRQLANPKVLELNKEIQKLIPKLKGMAGEKITLQTTFSKDPLYIYLDPDHLETVIVNIVSNSVDAMPEGGELRIKTEMFTSSTTLRNSYFEAPPGDYAVLIVEDTGIGMTDEVKEHIFEPFYTTKGLGKGTGLGLSTVYGIIKQAKGFVEVKSEVNKGTTFKIFLQITSERVSEQDNNILS